MKTIGIKCVGLKTFESKKGDKYTICYYISGPFEKGVEGNQAGFFFLNEDIELEVDENYTAILGYDRAGRYGVVGIYS